MKTFCREANFSSFINLDELPDSLKPHFAQLQDLLKPEEFNPKTQQSFRSHFQPLDQRVYELLILRLNTDHSNDCLWVSSDQWCSLSAAEAQLYRPVASEVKYQHRINFDEVVFSTFEDNPNNGVVQLKSFQSGALSFGMISNIFTHQRTPVERSDPVLSTWISVECFPPIPPSSFNPFHDIGGLDSQVHLRLTHPRQTHLFSVSEIVAHCEWIVYKPGEFNEEFTLDSIALLPLDR